MVASNSMNEAEAGTDVVSLTVVQTFFFFCHAFPPLVGTAPPPFVRNLHCFLSCAISSILGSPRLSPISFNCLFMIVFQVSVCLPLGLLTGLSDSLRAGFAGVFSGSLKHVSQPFHSSFFDLFTPFYFACSFIYRIIPYFIGQVYFESHSK